MDRKYWDKMAPGYDDEIFDVLHNDKKHLIRRALKKLSGPGKSVIDIGCAVGKWLPVLSPAFGKVMAIDISKKNLLIAKQQHASLPNVEFRQVDMSSKNPALPLFDVAVCVNAILTPSLKKRNLFFSNVNKILNPGGSLILVVPSLESWLNTRIVQHRWQIDKKLFAEKFTDKALALKYRNLLQGNADIDHVATKHYMREELGLLLSEEGFEVNTIQKIEYNWHTEFVDPPEWIKSKPGPWDWMVLATKT
jgi:2-polyprenyl-3-methyl-5-hydroxy-6-metoxy-1,4-benzoquinol methylase